MINRVVQKKKQNIEDEDHSKKCVLLIEDHMVSPDIYEASIPYAFMVAKSAKEGLTLLRYGYKCIDAIVINDEVFNLIGLLHYIKNNYPHLPQLIMTGNKTYKKPYFKNELITIIQPPFDMESIKNGLRGVFNKLNSE